MTIAKQERLGPSARRAAAIAALLAALPALAWPAAGESRQRPAGSHRAKSREAGLLHERALHATDSATLHYVSSTVNVFYETGRAAGTLPGWMRVHMRLGARFSGRYVIEAKGGTISGSGSAIPHGSGTYESFAGTIAVTGGTGRYRHAHGHAQVYGTFNRINNQLKLRTTGTLHY